jgi:tryptophan 2,3-dioxygenase
MEITPELHDRLQQLADKYAAMGQSLTSYLDGLLHADYLTYWDYIHLDTLLSLQNPRTPFPDENIFIIYHQITELYFNLILRAAHQVCEAENLSADLFKRQLKRIHSYFTQLINSFEIMVEGLDKTEFLQFRMSLLPSSGFQSVQYRKIELVSTVINNLVHIQHRKDMNAGTPVATLYDNIYWKWGATELATGKKTLTLKQFENKYSAELIRYATNLQQSNLWVKYQELEARGEADEELRDLLREHDHQANVAWPLSHYRSAARHLESRSKVIEATGGTNWQQYLPPKFQRVIFYPDLLTAEEMEIWGKSTNRKEES